MTSAIAGITAIEILDSRGFPTIRVNVSLRNGTVGTASIPSGASTGKNEATELRDGDPGRYAGKGVRQAVQNVETEIAAALIGLDPTRQAGIDRTMIDLDGTENKSRLGANAILGVSQAVARAAALTCGLPLYAYLGGVGATRLPIPMMNVLNGGKHADSSLDFQEFMIMPFGAPSFAEALRYGSETFQALKAILHGKAYATSVGDEGGFAPQLTGGNEEACELIVAAIDKAGFKPGEDIGIAIDPAASSFYSDGKYHLTRSGQGDKSAAEMVDMFRSWVDKYPLVLIEDGHAEEDWDGFKSMTAELGDRIQVVGDDNLVTNPGIIARAIEERACNSALIKLNQIGTVSETVAAIDLCRKAGWSFVVSHRSGETEDAFLADFAVAMGGGQIKSGSLCRSERIAKYNRLLEIEAELGKVARFGR